MTTSYFRRGICTLLAILLFAGVAFVLIMCIPIKEKSLSITHDFGIGFDLNPSYATVAVSYPNGSIYNIARVEGDGAYREMMRRLSLPSSQHIHEPHHNVGEGFADIPRQMWRSFRRRLGLAASWDAGTLSNMISILRAEATVYVGEHISAAGISKPHLIALYTEDVKDAFEHLGLINLELYRHGPGYYTLPATLAAYAGNGQGLCANYTDYVMCRQEEQQREERFMLAVSYSYHGLLTSQVRLRSAWGTDETARAENLDLGYADRDRHQSYFDRVRDMLRAPVVENWLRRNVTGVILHGDAVDEPQFREILEGVVDELIEGEQQIFDRDPVFSAARGIAEMSKRFLFRTRNVPSLSAQASEETEL
ncbi:hypothetical protein GGR57DRAFT_463809 [Xylariaceae sp. FL1272]|nr:hypothetical protein GGR57DRAFT_463809 [Xylariaceae sp. FL1272]